jgi:subtilisin family serine protease
VAFVAILAAAAGTGNAAAAAPRLSVGYSTQHALSAALARAHGTLVRRLPALHVAEVRAEGSPLGFAARIACLPGIRYVEPLAARSSRAEPGLAAGIGGGLPLEWAYTATHEDTVPADVKSAASAFTIAVIDTGADLTAPDLAAKAPTGFNAHSRTTDVSDLNGHGTFVASIAAGSATNGEGIAGFGGDARLLIIKAFSGGGFSDVDEATAIVYAVDHGARIINLSLAGPRSSTTERNAVAYAASHGALLVAAAGNDALNGNPVEYPAALLQPAGSDGVGGSGLAVGASDAAGARAPFSSFGSYLSLAAPGVDVLGAVSSAAPFGAFQPAGLPGSAGRYGYGTGTSFAAPQVAGAAALVWAANPYLSARGVATILKQTASGSASWTPELGYGVVDAAAAVARASSTPTVALEGVRARKAVRLIWHGHGVSTFRVLVSEDGGPNRVAVGTTTATTATVSLATGHAYVFTVAGLDPDGMPLAGSAPYPTSLH